MRVVGYVRVSTDRQAEHGLGLQVQRKALADWCRTGGHRVTTGEPVIDVSEGNDWSQVRVWWDPASSMGASTYPAYGFIAP